MWKVIVANKLSHTVSAKLKVRRGSNLPGKPQFFEVLCLAKFIFGRVWDSPSAAGSQIIPKLDQS